MNSKVAMLVVLAILAHAAVLVIFIRKADASQSQTAAILEQSAQANIDAARLREQMKKLESLIPDQAAVMSHVGYHFTNLWFAANQENWPLADFYLGETRANIKWAVRAKPIRKGADGKEFELAPIAQALDNTNLAGLKAAINAQDKAQFVKQYNETLSMCYACHKTAVKPYLRPQIPANPEVRVINMDPKATTPQSRIDMLVSGSQIQLESLRAYSKFNA